ncbi:DUF3304 domain-containing protein [Pseudomonas aeruginosa]|nr:DUF3304 domain-containing protein [Pseudomonas aeruginosa]RUI49137.1 DUF3304 domain-containing protein [Pseudomonas aeruginosa]
MREHGVLYVRHKETVDISSCDSKEICSLEMHFLPCDKVTTSVACYTPFHPEYPNKGYFDMRGMSCRS